MSYRVCEVCGKKYGRRGLSPAAWQKTRFCSLACVGKAKTMEAQSRIRAQQKVCEVCGKLFSRPDWVRPHEWEARRFCSEACHRNAGPGQGGVLCECGNQATRTIYFTQARADGSIMPGNLAVCADCYDYMLEHDPGCSTEPQPFTERARLWREDAEQPYQPRTGGFANRRSYHD